MLRPFFITIEWFEFLIADRSVSISLKTSLVGVDSGIMTVPSEARKPYMRLTAQQSKLVTFIMPEKSVELDMTASRDERFRNQHCRESESRKTHTICVVNSTVQSDIFSFRPGVKWCNQRKNNGIFVEKRIDLRALKPSYWFESRTRPPSRFYWLSDPQMSKHSLHYGRV